MFGGTHIYLKEGYEEKRENFKESSSRWHFSLLGEKRVQGMWRDSADIGRELEHQPQEIPGSASRAFLEFPSTGVLHDKNQ